MKIAIISDIHDNLPNLKACLNWCEQNNIDTAICCGDVTNSETLEIMAVFFTGGFYLVGGNMEIYDESEIKLYRNIIYKGRAGGIANSGGKKFGFCHEPLYINDILKQCELVENCRIIFYGHTHQPWEYSRQGIRIINPGTVAGTFSRATFAVWNTESGKTELKLIEAL